MSGSLLSKVVIACGGRNFGDKELVCLTLDRVNASLVITGGASGADRLAEKWAALRGVPFIVMPALWAGEGAGAGPRRNQRMIDLGLATMLVAFPGGRGTADMIRRAKTARLDVFEIEEEAK